MMILKLYNIIRHYNLVILSFNTSCLSINKCFILSFPKFFNIFDFSDKYSYFILNKIYSLAGYLLCILVLYYNNVICNIINYIFNCSYYYKNH